MPTPAPKRTAYRTLGAALLLAASPPLPAQTDWRAEVGYTRLLQTFVTGVPTAASPGLAQIEAIDINGNYAPNAGDSRFTGKSFTLLSGTSAASGHATFVGAFIYGSTSSLVPATTAVDIYSASNAAGTGWINRAPYTDTRLVQNHSWVARANNFPVGANLNQEALAANLRVDVMANQGSIIVAGMDNEAASSLPVWLTQGYNLISVGRSDGAHSAGTTIYDGAGRIKPDIVSFETTTSGATGQVSSAAALLAQRLTDAPFSRSDADLPRITKALLLAGATKEKFPSWTRSSTQPLDLRYGAGELNVLLAYRTLLGGPVAPSNSVTAPNTAWAHAQIQFNTQERNRTYFFDVPAGSTHTRFSAALVWHRPATFANGSFSYSPPTNLSLTLLTATNFTTGSVVTDGTSNSAADNVEHIYLPSLPPGRYALQVSTAAFSSATDYALAWRTSPTVTVAATVASTSESNPSSPAVFTLTRTGPTTSPLFVPLAWGGTAVSGTHYSTPPAGLLIPAGSASATVSITPVADSLAQGDRSVTLSVATDFSLSAGTPSAASATIHDKPYDAWRHARFSSAQLADPAVSGDSADPDGDGLANLLEYAFAGEPLTPASVPAERLPAVGLAEDGRLTLTYFHAADRPDLAHAVEWTDDLAAGPAGWQTGTGVVTEITRAPVEGGELVTVRADATPAAAPRQFLRLRVTRL